MPSTMVELDQSTIERLDFVANAMQLSREMTLHRAITKFIEDWELVKEVDLGLADIEAGRVHSNDEVSAYFAAKRNALNATLGK